jgi:hypothetical protein
MSQPAIIDAVHRVAARQASNCSMPCLSVAVEEGSRSRRLHLEVNDASRKPLKMMSPLSRAAASLTRVWMSSLIASTASASLASKTCRPLY